MISGDIKWIVYFSIIGLVATAVSIAGVVIWLIVHIDFKWLS